MALTAAERQARRRKRVSEQLAEVAHLRAVTEDQAALIASLEDQVSGRRAPRCGTHGTELACPQCYRGDDSGA